MAKAPRPGKVKTRLTPPCSPEEAAALYRGMLVDTVRLARGVGVATALMVPAPDVAEVAAIVGPDLEIVPQEGRGLAAALTFVFAHFAARGSSRIVALDSDSPTLPPEQIHAAFTLLDGYEVAIGPTEDGGYYLVGARGAHDALFASPTIGTASALDALEAAAAALGLTSGRTLEWYDVDTAQDLARLERDLESNPTAAPETAALIDAFRKEGRLA
jgi:rSAM/selenodomain-associated transferase 1